MRIHRITAILIFAFLSDLRSQDKEILRAMKDEMERSMASLRMENQPAPYYIAYTVLDRTTTNHRATLGAPLDETSGHNRTLRVEVRVGNYDFDSSRFLSFDREAGVVPVFAPGGMSCTLDDNYDAMRRQIWLTTDAAYKRAVQVYSKKKAAFQNRVETEPIPDFSKEETVQTILPVKPPAGVGKEWTDAVRPISAVFSQMPEIYSSEASLSVMEGTRYFLNSEGFKTVEPIRSAFLRVTAETQAEDGMPLRDFIAAFGHSPQDLPQPSELTARARRMATDLASSRKAPVGDNYNGPVLIEGQAAGEFLAQTLIPLFLSLRPPDSENPRMGGMMSQTQVTPFLTRIGSRVLPDTFTASDTPSLNRYGDSLVPGAYMVDDEGVPAQDVVLVRDGKLQALLTSRTPQKGFLKSNGHARGTGAQAGVFQLQSSEGIPAAQMKEKLLDVLKQEGKPFGYIVRSVANPLALQSASMDSEDIMMVSAQMMGSGGARMGPQILSAVRVTPDGKEEPVRGLHFGNVSHSAFRDILYASGERTVYNYRQSPGGSTGMILLAMGGAGESASMTTSVIAPNLLFEELEIQKGRDVQQKPPIVPSPIR